MRRILFAAAAFGPLLLAATPALSASISSARTTPIATSTAGTAGPDDVTLTTDGSIKLTTAGQTAVTLDSNNTVTNGGLIEFDDANNTTGVAIQGGTTGGLTNTGTIQVIENFTPPDANSDGVYEAPLAVGSGRFGVRVTGPAPFTGSLTNSGSIYVEGVDSAAISVETTMQGSIAHSGTIGVTGDRSFGIHTTAPVTGDITLTGTVSVSGQAASAVSIGGDVGGALKLYSSVSANAYSTATRSTVTDTLKLIQGTAAEQQQSGPALIVGGDVAGGVYLGAPPVGTTTTTTTDGDADGIADNAEGSGSISNFGSSPALLIGGTGRSVNIGTFGTGTNAYGVILRGGVSTTGLYDGVTSTAIQIGGTGSTATIAGGVRLTGTITTSAYEANATGLRVGAGGVVPEFRNENTLSAAVLTSAVTAASASTATGIKVDAGGTLSSLTNYGVIAAGATGPSVSATAVSDQSGTLAVINNLGTISAILTPATTGATVGGRAIALDLRANTSGVTLTQTVNPSPIVLVAATTNTTTPTTPTITGDVLLGSGPNTVSLQGGTMTGALDLGSGASTISIGGGAVYTGALSHQGSALTVNVTSGSLVNTNASTLQLQSLNVGAAGLLSFAIDPAAGKATSYQVSGPATFASGAQIGVNLLSPVNGTQSYTLITSPALSVASLASLQTETPYAVVANLKLDTAAGALGLDVRRRTAAEAGFDAGQTAAYNAISAALPKDASIQSALFTPTDRAGFVGVYNQLLPDYSGGTFRMASDAARAMSRATVEPGPGGAWVQEISVGARQSSGHGGAPYRALGFGFAGGVERDSSIGVLGVKASFITGDSRNHTLPGDTRATLTDLGTGVYWRAAVGGLKLDASAGAGYDHYTFKRQLLLLNSAGTTALSRIAEARAGGWSTVARLGAAYQIDLGAAYLRPQAHFDYFRLVQGGYTETGGGDAFDLAVARRTGSESSGTASVVLGAQFGHDFVVRPELELGYRNIFSSDPGVTTARVASGGDSFSIYALGLESGGPIARLLIRAGGETYDFTLGVGAERREGYVEGDVQVKARFLF